MTDQTPDRAHRAAFTVTVTSRPDGGHYFDGDDFSAHVAQWIKTDLRDHHAIAEVTVATPDQALRDRVAALFRQPPGAERLGDATPGEIADAVLSVLPPDGRAALLRAADIAEDVAESLRKHHEFERSTGALDVMTVLRRLAAGERDEQQTQQGGAETRIGQMADHWEQQLPEVIRTPAVVSAIRAALERADAPAAPVAGQPPADTGGEAREEIECANCWRAVENRSVPNMGGPSRDNWVHVPGGFQPCFPQRGADSPRAEPELTVAPQPETVHGCPPDGSGLTPCCGRGPLELPLTDRISSEVPVTCKGADRG